MFYQYFGFEGTDPPILEQYWTYSDRSQGLQPTLGIMCTGGGSDFLIFFAEVTMGGQTTGEWNECQGSGVTLTNPTGMAEILSDVGYYLSVSSIALDWLNFGSFPPPDQPGSEFIDLASLDGYILSAGNSLDVSVPEPSSIAILDSGLSGLLAYLATAAWPNRGLQLADRARVAILRRRGTLRPGYRLPHFLSWAVSASIS